MNSSIPSDSCILDNLTKILFQDTSLGPKRLLLKDTLGGFVSITSARVSPLCLTIKYRAGYCSRREVWPSHLSSQNIICEPSLILKLPNRKKCFLEAISPAQKCESPGFQTSLDTAFEPTYFLHRMVCHTPSWVRSLYNHLPSNAVFLTFKSCMPNPPYSLGRQTTFHLVNRYFFFSLSPAKRILSGNSPLLTRHLLVTGRMRSYTVPCW